ncbi:uncharacterized protein LOC129913588 [Episyrphus balteatus]|uniref:uncharacterized protein LOC129913588 n=1 Tax=Episyrphus balteatus TaxID=286459 RepID=UPI0024864CB9|nr:uncharacterized protein LOC129913588 [Episyrphus balteatus]XP_055848321.1 uncharacterized protein LOC129913588 [Episyrphus balteatus]
MLSKLSTNENSSQNTQKQLLIASSHYATQPYHPSHHKLNSLDRHTGTILNDPDSSDCKQFNAHYLKTIDSMDHYSVANLHYLSQSKIQIYQQSKSGNDSLSKPDQYHSNSNLSHYQTSGLVNHYQTTGNHHSLSKQHHSLKHNKTKNKGKSGGTGQKSSKSKSSSEEVQKQQQNRHSRKHSNTTDYTASHYSSSDSMRFDKNYY